MTDAPPPPEALEAAVSFLWPHYTDKKVDRMQFAAGSIECQRLARALNAFAAEVVKRERRKWEADRAAGWNAAHGIGGKLC